MNTQSNSNAGSGCPATTCSASSEAVQYADYVLNHYSRDSHADKLCLACDLERHGWKKSSFASLPWWRKDALGWPIETFKGKPVKSAIRIICQNIRKVICKPNAREQARRAKKFMEHDNQPSSRCLTCWALAVTLEKADIDGWKTTTTQRQMLGSRFCESEDEAVGSFLRECLTQNQGFKAGQVLALRINWPNGMDEGLRTPASEPTTKAL